MKTQFRKVKHYIDIVKKSIYCNERNLENVTYCPCDYKKDNTPPPLSEFKPFTVGESFGQGKDTHAWFHFNLQIPEDMKELPRELIVKSEFEYSVGSTPQFLLYINGEIRMGMDTRHISFLLDDVDDFDV